MIEIYGKENCLYCTSAKELLNSKNISYKYYNLGEHYTLDEFKELFPGQKTVPVILSYGLKIGGFDDLKAYIRETTDELI